MATWSAQAPSPPLPPPGLVGFSASRGPSKLHFNELSDRTLCASAGGRQARPVDATFNSTTSGGLRFWSPTLPMTSLYRRTRFTLHAETGALRRSGSNCDPRRVFSDAVIRPTTRSLAKLGTRREYTAIPARPPGPFSSLVSPLSTPRADLRDAPGRPKTRWRSRTESPRTPSPAPGRTATRAAPSDNIMAPVAGLPGPLTLNALHDRQNLNSPPVRLPAERPGGPLPRPAGRAPRRPADGPPRLGRQGARRPVGAGLRYGLRPQAAGDGRRGVRLGRRDRRDAGPPVPDDRACAGHGRAIRPLAVQRPPGADRRPQRRSHRQDPRPLPARSR